MDTEKTDLLHQVADYYDDKLQRHGVTAQGVDWNGDASQTLRFAELSRVIAGPEGFSVNDLGCGYGALHDHLAQRGVPFSYNGYDVSSEMIEAARDRLPKHP